MASTLDIRDSADSVDIAQNILSSKTNKWTNSNLSAPIVVDGVELNMPSTIFANFREIIDANLMNIPLDPKHYFKPEAVSLDLYGTSDLWWLVLLASNITSHKDFNIPRINVMNSSALYTLNELIEAHADVLSKQITITDLTMFPIKI